MTSSGLEPESPFGRLYRLHRCWPAEASGIELWPLDGGQNVLVVHIKKDYTGVENMLFSVEIFQ
jgi:hypothetical protein